jgi:hypothetical protein
LTVRRRDGGGLNTSFSTYSLLTVVEVEVEVETGAGILEKPLAREVKPLAREVA